MMMRSAFCLLPAAALMLGGAPGTAQPPAVRPALSTVALPPAELRSTQQFTLHSAINGKDYLVQVLIPRRPPPPGGYPTLFLLDGDALFGGFAQAMANRANAHEIAAAVVVGIAGAPGEQGGDRTQDFTFSDLTPREKTIIKDLGSNPRFGGAERFYEVLQGEIRPRIAALAPVDPGRATLMGWSLGGHFTMHVMFEHPEAFHSFVALSPALWRSDRILFRALPGFARRLRATTARPALFIAVGSREEEVTPGLMAGQISHEALVREFRYGRMVGNVRDMAGRLRPLFARHAMVLRSRIFTGDTHNSMPWSAINPVLDFAFPLGG
jgi:uncharacterized protein